MKLKILLFIIICPLGFLTACHEVPTKSNAVLETEAYLERQGYELVSLVEEESLLLDTKTLMDPGYSQIWQVQPFDSAEYLDQPLTAVEFIIQGHPLELLYNSQKTRIIVYLHQNQVIGGWSLPVFSSEVLVGTVHSLDGKTAEEVQ